MKLLEKRVSPWFAGLKLAESIGTEHAEYLLNTYEFNDCELEFKHGVIDYIAHERKVKAKR